MQIKLCSSPYLNRKNTFMNLFFSFFSFFFKHTTKEDSICIIHCEELNIGIFVFSFAAFLKNRSKLECRKSIYFHFSLAVCILSLALHCVFKIVDCNSYFF